MPLGRFFTTALIEFIEKNKLAVCRYVTNTGTHLRIANVIDYWPNSEAFYIKHKNKRGRGDDKLLDAMRRYL